MSKVLILKGRELITGHTPKYGGLRSRLGGQRGVSGKQIPYGDDRKKSKRKSKCVRT
jgi:hypothetical protein